MEVSFPHKKAEPQESIYGDVARTYFYMRDRYGLRISKKQEKMLIAWNNLDPVDRWEKKRNLLIKKFQGDENLYVSEYKKIDQLGERQKDISISYENVKGELSEEYGFILEKLSAPLAALLLMLMTFFVMYRRKKAKKIKR